MLKFLHIENIAVIETADIEFKSGFNALTGETGAGKSIIIDSLNAALGERTYREIIRSGCDKAQVSALFSGLSKETLNLLAEQDLAPDEEGNVLLSRTISADGRSVLRLNGAVVTASVVKEIVKSLVSIHGQHDNQSLLNSDHHYEFIDAIAENGDVLEKYYNLYERLCNARRRYKKLSTDETEKLNRIDLLTYQINEIESAKIKVGEKAQLDEMRKRFQNMEAILQALNMVNGLVNGGDDMPGAASLAQDAAVRLASINDVCDAAEPLSDRLASVGAELSDIGFELRGLISGDGFDPAAQSAVEERLDILYRILRKYGPDEESCLKYLEDSKAELASIENSDEEKKKLEIEISDLEDKIVAAAKKLTDSRRKAGDNFAKQICDALEQLNMPNSKFVVDISPAIYSRNGADRVEFLISANAGEEPRPLLKIASGGELSRIMLAIKSVLSDKDGISTLIFDEIDAGVSGRTAVRVAEKLKKVAESHQVICITHLAQIAAVADNHLLISKSVENERTRTVVEPLEGEERINEVARIISGGEMTESLYNTAKELLNNGLTTV